MADQGKPCELCLDTAETVVRLEHVGGRNYQEVRQCVDLEKCWDRWGIANGLAPRTIEPVQKVAAR